MIFWTCLQCRKRLTDLENELIVGKRVREGRGEVIGNLGWTCTRHYI